MMQLSQDLTSGHPIEIGTDHRNLLDMHPKRVLEALLFASSEPLPLEQLAQVCEISPTEVKGCLDELAQEYEERGLQLVQIANGYQICTRSEDAEWLKRLNTRQVVTRLSSAALETLAIIAYKQPIPRGEVEEIRGVNSDSTINSLLEKGMIRIAGRKQAAGRPLLFATTDEFLKHFGLRSLADLPSLEEMEELLAEDRDFVE